MGQLILQSYRTDILVLKWLAEGGMKWKGHDMKLMLKARCCNIVLGILNCCKLKLVQS